MSKKGPSQSLCGREISENKPAGRDDFFAAKTAQINAALGLSQVIEKSRTLNVEVHSRESSDHQVVPMELSDDEGRTQAMMSDKICDNSPPQKYLGQANRTFYGKIAQYLKSRYAALNHVSDDDVECKFASSNNQVSWFQYRDTVESETTHGDRRTITIGSDMSCYRLQFNYDGAELKYGCHRTVPKSDNEWRVEYCNVSQQCLLSQKDPEARMEIAKERDIYCKGDINKVFVSNTSSSQAAVSNVVYKKTVEQHGDAPTNALDRLTSGGNAE